MRTLGFIIVKELQQLRRNKFMMFLLLVMPIIQLTVLSYAADFEIRHLKLVVVDLDHSQISRGLIQSFTSSGYFELAGTPASNREALAAFESETADMILQIQPGFASGLKQGKTQPVQLLANAVNNQKAGIAMQYAGQVIENFNASLLSGEAKAVSGPEIHSSLWYNETLNYKTFMVPGILAVLVTMLTAFLSAMNIIREKEMGTVEQLNVTPIRKYEFILGKLIPFWFIGLVVLTVGLGVGWLLFGIGIKGNAVTLYAFAALYILGVLGIGMFISTLVETQQQAMFITWFFMVIFILLSGLFTPADGMPAWAQAINTVNPLKYFIEVTRLIMLKGGGWTETTGHFAVMGGFVLVFNVLAITSYRKTA